MHSKEVETKKVTINLIIFLFFYITLLEKNSVVFKFSSAVFNWAPVSNSLTILPGYDEISQLFESTCSFSHTQSTLLVPNTFDPLKP